MKYVYPVIQYLPYGLGVHFTGRTREQELALVRFGFTFCSSVATAAATACVARGNTTKNELGYRPRGPRARQRRLATGL